MDTIDKKREATKVVTPDGKTIAQLRSVFEAVCNKDNWKASWAAYVPYQLVQTVVDAVAFFHADIPTVVGTRPIDGKVLMTGNGYQAN